MTRRYFLSAAGAAGLAAGKSKATVNNDSGGFRLGLTTWSLRYFQRPLAIEMIQQMQTPYVTFTTNEEPEVRKYFDYAKTCGMPMIICAPTHQNVGLVEKLAKEYDIKAAIHNHGPMDKHFPTPQSILGVVKTMDPRMGLCMDVGHTAASRVDIVQAMADAGPRLLDMHIKDVRVAADETSGCDVGEGVLPIMGIFRQLKKMNYRGTVNLEYEFNYSAPLTGMLKSFAYMRGALEALNS
jgi:sugar phosphate isomerase/epimerase